MGEPPGSFASSHPLTPIIVSHRYTEKANLLAPKYKSTGQKNFSYCLIYPINNISNRIEDIMIEEYLIYKIAENTTEPNQKKIKSGVKRFLYRIWNKAIESYIEETIANFKNSDFFNESIRKFNNLTGGKALNLYTLKNPEYEIDDKKIGDLWGRQNETKYWKEIIDFSIDKKEDLVKTLLSQNVIEKNTLVTKELDKVLIGSNLTIDEFLNKIKDLRYDEIIIKDTPSNLRYLSTTEEDIKLFKTINPNWKEIEGVKKELEKTILGQYENQEELISEIVSRLYSPDDKRCAYCDTPIQVKNIESGLDRLDSSKNYLEDNLVFCCPKCNTMKSSDSPQQFIDKIKSINNNIIDKTKDIDLEQYLSQSKSVITDTVKSVRKELLSNLSSIASEQRKQRIKTIIKTARYNQLINLLYP